MRSSQDENIRLLIDRKYNSLSLEDKQLLHKLYLENESNHNELYYKLRKIVFRLEPPTPEEFLDPRNGWITQSFRDGLLPHVIEDFLDILNPEKKYNQVVEYGATRLGKSFLARLLIQYTIIFVHCLRHPQLYYSLAPTTQLSIYIMCFNSEKVKQLLLKPVYNFLNASPRFKQIKFQDKVKEEQYKNGLDTIYWSKAATFGEITLDSDLTINLGTDFMSFIGSDMLMLIVSEIAFFTEKLGATHEQIFQIYSDGLDRIKATIGNNYLGMVYLDTSANDTDNPIEQYILKELQYQQRVFFRQRNRWEARPNLFPIWQKTGETFSLFTGDKVHPPKFVEESDPHVLDLDRAKIINVPIDVKPEFEINILKSIKDICGIPTSKENKLITNFNYITNIFNNPYLKNVESILYAESKDFPELLLWDQIKNKFFSKSLDDKLFLYRAPQELRVVGLDLAHSLTGDIQGFALGHKELSKATGNTMYIIDFAFTVGSKEGEINLEAPLYLVKDLITYGNVNIKQVFADQFQSKAILQHLERLGVEVKTQSVDRSILPYQYLVTTLHNETLKAGKNIFLKNNLDSLIRDKSESDKEIIDHRKGKTNNAYNGNWQLSKTGINAKDLSDAVCHVVWGLNNFDYTPVTVYEEENEKINMILEKTNNKNKNVIAAWGYIHQFY